MMKNNTHNNAKKIQKLMVKSVLNNPNSKAATKIATEKARLKELQRNMEAGKKINQHEIATLEQNIVNHRRQLEEKIVNDKPLLNEVLGRSLLAKLTEVNACKELAEYTNSEFKSENPIERMLIDQMVAVHKLSMALLSNVYGDDSSFSHVQNITNLSMRMMEVYQKGVLTLNKLRTAGNQTVVVKHQYVQVNEGGQAVITHDFNGERQGEGKNGK